MTTQIVNLLVRLRRTTLGRALRRTLVVIFPFVLVGTFAKLIVSTLLMPDSFLYSILFLDRWVNPAIIKTLASGFTVLGTVTVGMISLYVAYAMAMYTAKLYQRDPQMAGLAGLTVMLMLAYRVSQNNRANLDWMITSYGNLFFALVVGYLVGQSFRWLGKPRYQSTNKHLDAVFERTYGAFKPMLLVFGVSLIISILLNLASYYSLLSQLYGSLQAIDNGNQPVWLKLLVILLSTGLNWLGLSGPYYNGDLVLDSSQASIDLTYLLTHHGHGAVPYPYLTSVLQKSFANFGGTSLTLALLIALIFVTKRKNYHRLIRTNLIPVLFNADHGFTVGLPVILNPIYLIPVIGLPFINIAIASLGIAWHWYPTPVYPIPQGTPGILYAFFGTNGNWAALLMTMGLLVLDVICYVPFVKLALRVDNTVQKLDQEAD
ncbi:PTS transporter subunit EIIC [Lactobacillus sp. 3B(2020)]|uniref:PTS transporter subunit EIIC n=1 Tax=Lactobacillus sp. 3B(2020) TaxID=2695882 RepID=UPI0015DE134A|nr:PTS transporter subunit EIIC [Lactobacillus sp. 3B(2020)]QLL69947.1 PTS transporter subunit EIIC [Lactobacillus sp. 3B(2020)]